MRKLVQPVAAAWRSIREWTSATRDLIPSPGDQNLYVAGPVSCRSDLPHRPRDDRFSSTRLGITPSLPKPRFLQGAVLIGGGDAGIAVASHEEDDPVTLGSTLIL